MASNYKSCFEDEKRLWEAATEGNLNVVKELMERNDIDVNWADPQYNRTPFYRACGHGQVKVVEYMLKDSRIDVDKRIRDYGTPFYIACQEAKKEVVECLIKDPRIVINSTHKDGYTPLCIAAQCGNVEVVKILLNDKRVDINKGEKQQNSPLHLACNNGKLEVIKWLLISDRSVDINSKNSSNCTPIQIAEVASNEGIRFWESIEEEQERRENCLKILEILKFYQNDPELAIHTLKYQLGILGK